MNPEINIQPLREVSLPYGNLRSQLLDGAILFRGNIMEELWKPIRGYEGLYEISNFGRAKSLERIIIRKDGRTKPVKEKIMIGGYCTRGYHMVGLSKNNILRNKQTHQLVWDHFGDKPRNGYLLSIDHIDNNFLNNRIDNLQLLPIRDNIIKGKLFNKNNNLPLGVQKNGSGFMANIRLNGKRVYLGTYRTTNEASEAYQQKLKEVI